MVKETNHTIPILLDSHCIDHSRYLNYNEGRDRKEVRQMTERTNEEMKDWSEEKKQAFVNRIITFISGSDEEHFHRITDGLSNQEIEEYLEECPEFRKYWRK